MANAAIIELSGMCSCKQTTHFIRRRVVNTQYKTYECYRLYYNSNMLRHNRKLQKYNYIFLRQ